MGGRQSLEEEVIASLADTVRRRAAELRAEAKAQCGTGAGHLVAQRRALDQVRRCPCARLNGVRSPCHWLACPSLPSTILCHTQTLGI